jgi:hypothetical protein
VDPSLSQEYQEGMSAMKDQACEIHLITMVRNEADILPTFLARATALFDKILVVDHQSTDGTRFMLDEAAKGCDRIEVFEFRYRAYYQKEISNCLARHAFRNGADWVLFLDADEFLDVEDGQSLKNVFRQNSHEVMHLRWMNLVPSAFGTFNEFDASQSFRWDGRLSKFGKIAIKSTFAAHNPYFFVHQGNHSVSRSRFEGRVAMEDGPPILHVPIRSLDRLRYKLAAGMQAYRAKSARKPGTLDGKHWFELHNRLEEGTATSEWINGVIARYGEPLGGVHPVDVTRKNWRDKQLHGAVGSEEGGDAISLSDTIEADGMQTWVDLATVDDAILRAEVHEGQVLLRPQPMRSDGNPHQERFSALLPVGDAGADSFDERDLAAAASQAFIPIRQVVPSAWTEHTPFLFTLFRLMRPRRYVELGSHCGMSFFAACQAADQLNLDTQCVAIDGWIGDEHAGFYDNQTFEDFKVNLKSMNHASSYYIRSFFDQSLSCFDNGSIDLLHIDGLHTYEAVKNDYVTWLPKMSSRGVMLFHDTNVYERGFGVWRLWNELKARYPHFQFPHCHGLGVIYVGDEPSAVAGLLRHLEQDEGMRTAAIGFFAELGSMSVKRAVQERELVALRADKEWLMAERERLVADRDWLMGEKARLLAEQEVILAEKETLAEEVARHRETIDYIWTTTSWRLTRPVRMVGKTLRGVRRTIRKIA